MKNVFISSVVEGFKEFRAAARKAVETSLNHPVMCEDFGSRPHNSEIACMTEVQQSDIYVLILGEKYGWEPPQDLVSVTHREYLTAREANKPILVCIQDGPKEPKQEQFVRSVQDYHNGYFRATFATPEDLKDAISKSLNQLKHNSDSESRASFEACLREAEQTLQNRHELNQRNEPLLQVAFWSQPAAANDIIAVEKQSDEYFSKIHAARLASLKDGYKTITGSTFTAIKCSESTLVFFENGLVVLRLNPVVQDQNSHFAFQFVSPSRVQQLALACSAFVKGYSAWVSLKVSGMEHKNFEELPPASQTSYSLSMYGPPEKEFVKLFSPYNKADYEEWIEHSIAMMERCFKSN